MAFDREELLRKLTLALALNPGMTMTELAVKTGISKASLHRIYATKENLQNVIVERLKKIPVELGLIIDGAHENYLGDLRDLISVLYKNRAYILFMFRDKIDDAEWKRCEEKLTDFFREGQRQGILSSDFTVEMMVYIFSGMSTWMMGLQAERDDLSEREVEEIIFKALLNGIKK